MLSTQMLDYPKLFAAGSMVSPIKILVLEDDHGTIDLLQSVLESDGFRLTAASAHPAGFEFLEELKPDVIVLVLDAPDAEGLAMCRKLRQATAVPILVLSSNGKPNFGEQVLDEGADDYLVKPTTSNLIVASLNKLTRRARAESAAVKGSSQP